MIVLVDVLSKEWLKKEVKRKWIRTIVLNDYILVTMFYSISKMTSRLDYISSLTNVLDIAHSKLIE